VRAGLGGSAVLEGFFMLVSGRDRCLLFAAADFVCGLRTFVRTFAIRLPPWVSSVNDATAFRVALKTEFGWLCFARVGTNRNVFGPALGRASHAHAFVKSAPIRPFSLSRLAPCALSIARGPDPLQPKSARPENDALPCRVDFHGGAPSRPARLAVPRDLKLRGAVRPGTNEGRWEFNHIGGWGGWHEVSRRREVDVSGPGGRTAQALANAWALSSTLDAYFAISRTERRRSTAAPWATPRSETAQRDEAQ
jgi:hypothetical protein